MHLEVRVCAPPPRPAPDSLSHAHVLREQFAVEYDGQGVVSNVRRGTDHAQGAPSFLHHMAQVPGEASMCACACARGSSAPRPRLKAAAHADAADARQTEAPEVLKSAATAMRHTQDTQGSDRYDKESNDRSKLFFRRTTPSPSPQLASVTNGGGKAKKLCAVSRMLVHFTGWWQPR